MALDIDEKKRVRLIFAVGAAVTVGLTLLLLLLINDREPGAEPPPKSYSLSDSDKTDIETTANLFMEEAGTYGVRESAVTPDTILGLREQISQSESADIFLSRPAVYTGLKTNYIAPGSPLDFSSVTDWSDAYLVDNMVTASVEGLSVSVPDDGYYMEDRPAVELSVSFTSKQTARWQTATDTSWDGTYDVLELEVPSSLTLTLVKDASGAWKVYSVANMNYPSLLALTADPNETALPEPKKVGTITTTVTLPPVTETESPAS